MKRTWLYQISQKEEAIMSFVIITQNDNCIVIDGGRKEDIPVLRKYINKRHISAWILTVPDENHIGGFISELERNKCADFDIEKIYFHFPSYKTAQTFNQKSDDKRIEFLLNNFFEILPLIRNKSYIVKQGDKINIDECEIEILYTYHKFLNNQPINDSSLVFKVNTPNKSVLFLSDLGTEGGELLFRESRDNLKADIVQMANHGYMNVGLEVYAEIAPEICLWCCPEEIFEETNLPENLSDSERLYDEGNIRMYGIQTALRWMNKLGVKKHFVSANGTYCIAI